MRFGLTRGGAIGWAALAAAILPPQTPAPAPQATFRGGVDLIAVEVQVVDGNGQPITPLASDKFEVTIDGRRRRVASVDLVQMPAAGAAGPTRPLAPGPAATNTWAPRDEPGRTFIIAMDVGSFESGDTAPIVQAVRGFVDRMAPEDRVGVFTLPPVGPRVDPSVDRTGVRIALDRIAGQRQSLASQFNLSTSEIIDINSETGGLGAPAAGSTAAGQDTLRRVQARECRNVTDLGCVESIVNEAGALGQHLEERAIQSLQGLRDLLTALRTYPGRKTVVVVSSGIAVSDRPGGRIDIGDQAKALGEGAAHANATIYAVHIDAGLSKSYSAQSRRARDAGSLERERRLSARLLEQFADASGGTVVPVLAGSGDIALDRVLRETSSYYLLGVEPADMDRDGRAHRLTVKIGQRGALVRSRQWVVLSKASGSKP
jgi:VWFA-related protein